MGCGILKRPGCAGGFWGARRGRTVTAEAPRPVTAHHAQQSNLHTQSTSSHRRTLDGHAAAVFALFPSLSLCVACRYESAELYWRLFDAAVPVKHLVFNKVRVAAGGAGTAVSSADSGTAAATRTGRSTPCHGVLWRHAMRPRMTATASQSAYSVPLHEATSLLTAWGCPCESCFTCVACCHALSHCWGAIGQWYVVRSALFPELHTPLWLACA